MVVHAGEASNPALSAAWLTGVRTEPNHSGSASERGWRSATTGCQYGAMIVIRCTAKLLERVGPPAVDPPASTSVLGDWYAKPFSVAQRRFVVLISAPSRLPIYVPLRGIASLPKTFPSALEAVLMGLGLAPNVVEREVAASREVAIARTNSKSTLGSLNEAAYSAQYQLRFEPPTGLVNLAIEAGRIGSVVDGDWRIPNEVACEMLLGDSPRSIVHPPASSPASPTLGPAGRPILRLVKRDD